MIVVYELTNVNIILYIMYYEMIEAEICKEKRLLMIECLLFGGILLSIALCSATSWVYFVYN